MEQTANLCCSWKENKGIERIKNLPLNLCPAQRREDENKDATFQHLLTVL